MSDYPDDYSDYGDSEEELPLPNMRLVLGVRVEDADLYRTERDCCPTCGRPAQKGKLVPIFDVSSWKPRPYLTARIPSRSGEIQYFSELDVVWATDSDGSLFAVIGLLLSISENNAVIQVPEPEKTRKVFSTALSLLEPLGLWKDEFGLWLVTLR